MDGNSELVADRSQQPCSSRHAKVMRGTGVDEGLKLEMGLSLVLANDIILGSINDSQVSNSSHRPSACIGKNMDGQDCDDRR
ncbi:hypothetical protein TKK_0002968 [Trichogramma kaykai]